MNSKYQNKIHLHFVSLFSSFGYFVDDKTKQKKNKQKNEIKQNKCCYTIGMKKTHQLMFIVWMASITTNSTDNRLKEAQNWLLWKETIFWMSECMKQISSWAHRM